MIWNSPEKRGKPCLEIIPGLWNTVSLNMAVRKGKLTERSSPRRMFPERSRWVRVVAVSGLALSDWERLFTPATWRRPSSFSTPGNKMRFGSVYKWPHQIAGQRLATSTVPKGRTVFFPPPLGVSGRVKDTAISLGRREKQNWLPSAPLLMWLERPGLGSARMRHESRTGHF